MVWKPLNTEPGARDPRPIGDSLPDVTKRLGLARPNVLTAVFARWDDVVGSPLRDHVRPVGLRDGALTVEVDEPAWATQLRFLEADLLIRVNEATGAQTVTELVVRVRGARGRGGRALKSPDFAGSEQPQKASNNQSNDPSNEAPNSSLSAPSKERTRGARRIPGKPTPQVTKKSEK
jgi:hypothetical protein